MISCSLVGINMKEGGLLLRLYLVFVMNMPQKYEYIL